MSVCEGVSTALSVLLSRFQQLPRVCYFDNGCNMARSIAMRLPWMNESSLIVCYRFHYKGHTYNSVCDTDSYWSCDGHVIFGTESLNHLLNLSKMHVRHLKRNKLIAFLAIRAVFINLKTISRKNTTAVILKIWAWVHFSESLGVQLHEMPRNRFNKICGQWLDLLSIYSKLNELERTYRTSSLFSTAFNVTVYVSGIVDGLKVCRKQKF